MKSKGITATGAGAGTDTNESFASNINKIVTALKSHGFKNIQKFETDFQGNRRTVVMGDMAMRGTMYSIQLYAGSKDEHAAFAPSLLIGTGDFPRCTHVYDPKNGRAITGGDPAAIATVAIWQITSSFRYLSADAEKSGAGVQS